MKSLLNVLLVKAALFLLTSSALAVTTSTQTANYFVDANGNVGVISASRQTDPATNITTTTMSYSFCVQTTAASCQEGSGTTKRRTAAANGRAVFFSTISARRL
jgi:hypothetical protein